MASVSDDGDEEFIDPVSPRATPARRDCFPEPATAGRRTPPRRTGSGGLEALDLNYQATELPEMNSSQGLLQSSPVRGTGPSRSTGCRANRHVSGGTAAAASGGTPRATVIPTGAGSSVGTPLFPATATGLEEDGAASLEDEDKGFGLGHSMNFSSSDDEDDSSDDEDRTLEVALNQLNMMQQYGAIACMLAGVYYHDTFMKKTKKRKTSHPDMNRK